MTEAAAGPWLIPSVTIVQHLINNCIVLVVLFVVDKALVNPWVASRTKSSRDASAARWFFLHAFANFFVV